MIFVLYFSYFFFTTKRVTGREADRLKRSAAGRRFAQYNNNNTVVVVVVVVRYPRLLFGRRKKKPIDDAVPAFLSYDRVHP